MHISVTRLKLRSPLLLLGFVKAANESVAQAENTRGFQTGALLVDQFFAFWTITGWDGVETMKAFRDSGAHKAVMPKLLDWCDEASVAQFQADAIPAWTEVHRIMVEQGRSTRVKRPSKNHLAGRISPIKLWAPARPLKPRS